MKPKLYMIAVYFGTKTYDNLRLNNKCVLQLLSKNHASLVNLLGKQSGKTKNKQAILEKRSLLTEWNGKKVLADPIAYLHLSLVDQKNIGGDHELMWFEVKKSRTNAEENVLMFQDLVKEGKIL